MQGLPSDTLLLLGCGIVTALPLMVYANGAKLLRLSTIAMMQYIAPTMIFLTAVFVFHEPFGQARMIAFPMIWAALAIYTWSMVRQARAAQLPGWLIWPPPTSPATPVVDGAGRGQAARDADGEKGEGLRFQHVAIQARGLDRLHLGRDVAGQHIHQRGVVAPAAGDEQAGDGRGEMLRPRARRRGRRRR